VVLLDFFFLFFACFALNDRSRSRRQKRGEVCRVGGGEWREGGRRRRDVRGESQTLGLDVSIVVVVALFVR
jgi:hypothetical protein